MITGPCINEGTLTAFSKVQGWWKSKILFSFNIFLSSSVQAISILTLQKDKKVSIFSENVFLKILYKPILIPGCQLNPDYSSILTLQPPDTTQIWATYECIKEVWFVKICRPHTCFWNYSWESLKCELCQQPIELSQAAKPQSNGFLAAPAQYLSTLTTKFPQQPSSLSCLAVSGSGVKINCKIFCGGDNVTNMTPWVYLSLLVVTSGT